MFAEAFAIVIAVVISIEITDVIAANISIKPCDNNLAVTLTQLYMSLHPLDFLLLCKFHDRSVFVKNLALPSHAEPSPAVPRVFEFMR